MWNQIWILKKLKEYFNYLNAHKNILRSHIANWVIIITVNKENLLPTILLIAVLIKLITNIYLFVGADRWFIS